MSVGVNNDLGRRDNARVRACRLAKLLMGLVQAIFGATPQCSEANGHGQPERSDCPDVMLEVLTPAVWIMQRQQGKVRRIRIGTT